MTTINAGVAFDCQYVKHSSGEIREFAQMRKLTHGPKQSLYSAAGSKAKRRVGTNYTSLTPFVCQDGSVVELYTRLFIKFNGEDVSL